MAVGLSVYLDFCKLGRFCAVHAMPIKDSKEHLLRPVSKVLFNTNRVLVGFIWSLWVEASLSDKSISYSEALQLDCLSGPIVKSAPVILTRERSGGRNVV